MNKVNVGEVPRKPQNGTCHQNHQLLGCDFQPPPPTSRKGKSGLKIELMKTFDQGDLESFWVGEDIESLEE
jgi:hypothetical protein